MRKNVFLIVIAVLLIFIFSGIYVALYTLNYITHDMYDNEYFGIETYKSSVDKDGDGVDDQTDILNSVREYIKTEPKYKSKYYNGGYPDDEYGVCTDVVAFGLKGAGYDLMELVDEDIKNNPDNYDSDAGDKNIDFRRVRNLKVYFKNNAISLTTDLGKIEEWQGGDIVIFDSHVGVISDKRNKKGVPFIIHNANPVQSSYEEDLLLYGYYKIVGHYRIS